MRKAFCAYAIALLGVAAIPAQAMPIALLSGADPGITLVAGGCGAGLHRGPYGGCVRNVGVVGAPVVRGPVVVAPAVRPVYGRRCVWRAGVKVCA